MIINVTNSPNKFERQKAIKYKKLRVLFLQKNIFLKLNQKLSKLYVHNYCSKTTIMKNTEKCFH